MHDKARGNSADPKAKLLCLVDYAYGCRSIRMIGTSNCFSTACDGWVALLEPESSSAGRSDHRPPTVVVAVDPEAAPACAESATGAGLKDQVRPDMSTKFVSHGASEARPWVIS